MDVDAKAKEILEVLARCERIVAPLRERVVLAEAVCEELIHARRRFDDLPKLKTALDAWERRRPLG